MLKDEKRSVEKKIESIGIDVDKRCKEIKERERRSRNALEERCRKKDIEIETEKKTIKKLVFSNVILSVSILSVLILMIMRGGVM